MSHRRVLSLASLTILLLVVSHARPTRAGSGADWPMWGYDLANHRYNPNETTITPANVAQLSLRWAFAFPDTMMASSQPTVIGDTVYVGSWNGNLYALDASTGQQKWAFFTGVTGTTGNVRVGPALAHDLVLFGDQLGRVFAINKDNGTLAWVQQQIDTHPLAQITGSLVVYGDRVYVPMASREENASTDPAYRCCTFRGSLTALNVADGSIAWRFYTVDPPHASGKLSGPSGAGIWTTPAIDPDEGLLYVSTGNSYSPPVSPFSDAILALNLEDGSLRWSAQLTQGDWANKGCEATPSVNCDSDQGEHGADMDFGSSPMLFSVQTSVGTRKLVTAEQKNGILHTLDALTGKVVWEQQVGQAVAYPWGLSFDGTRLYASDDTFGAPGGLYALDPATGAILWHTGALPCLPGPLQSAAACWSGYMTGVVSTPGLLWLGAMDGQIRAFDSATGQARWTYATAHEVRSVNRVPGHGGSIGPASATVANGQVYVMSGYAPWNEQMLDGNVMFVFRIPAPEEF